MRRTVEMTFIKGKNVRGYMGHWEMNYYVENVVDIETKELICQEYIFKGSTIFKHKGFKLGDKVRMDINVSKDNKGNVKLSYFSNVIKVDEEC